MFVRQAYWTYEASHGLPLGWEGKTEAEAALLEVQPWLAKVIIVGRRLKKPKQACQLSRRLCESIDCSRLHRMAGQQRVCEEKDVVYRDGSSSCG